MIHGQSRDLQSLCRHLFWLSFRNWSSSNLRIISFVCICSINSFLCVTQCIPIYESSFCFVLFPFVIYTPLSPSPVSLRLPALTGITIDPLVSRRFSIVVHVSQTSFSHEPSKFSVVLPVTSILFHSCSRLFLFASLFVTPPRGNHNPEYVGTFLNRKRISRYPSMSSQNESSHCSRLYTPIS